MPNRIRTLLPFVLLAASALVHADDGKVVQEVVLIRHGIRSPTAAPEKLAVYAKQAWPAWDVAPGQLTAHGAQLMQSWGGWYRSHLRSVGLLPVGCDANHGIRVIADSTPRNRDSALALWKGLSLGCASAVYALPSTQTDVLFHGVQPLGKPAKNELATAPADTLHELQRVLFDCDDQACFEQAKASGKTVPSLESPAKALKLAGTLSEDLMLEYAQGMPANQVGWGRADAATISRLITLHNASFAADMAIPDAAASRDGNLLAHVAATLTTTATGSASLPSLTRSGERALVLVGHDTDLAATARLLQLNWHNGTQSDDYAPATALIWQLVQHPHGYGVRLLVVQPTLSGLHAGSVSANGQLISRTLQWCNGKAECSFAQFIARVRQAVPADFISPDNTPESALSFSP